jgi:hypothetical protein
MQHYGRNNSVGPTAGKNETETKFESLFSYKIKRQQILGVQKLKTIPVNVKVFCGI